MTTTIPFAFLKRWPAVAAASFLLAAALGSCKKNEENTTPPTVMLTSNAALGSFLTDGRNNTLYYYTPDVIGTNACTGGCADEWPIFFAASVQVGPGLNAADFTTGRTASGRNQTFYKGWPLYYFAPEVKGVNVREEPGQVLGEGDDDQWYVARPDYTAMVAENTVTDKSTSKASIERYLIDPQGRTLYTYGKDKRLPASQTTNCQGGCVEARPVFYSATITVPSALKSSDFGTITRTDGPNGSKRLQTTYKGNPLYYYTPDNAVRGKAEGNGYTDGTDQWIVAAP
ncbi:hypothetical protein ACFQ48_00690 [Hymenobacter caeli]|uniref:Lipoprotein with Yx(FWY)xxD motif n=1 Tax=Hymenobacter caeli TaxID=2735894 RepID=A0ABX2FJQ5_9BACT|nr:hypothetical protein [Hymenobacter caeli]NRT17337.1 putative lipoprotein with Yx(FWY)xxD motif [Hymenobacter caeli]